MQQASKQNWAVYFCPEAASKQFITIITSFYEQNNYHPDKFIKWLKIITFFMDFEARFSPSVFNYSNLLKK
jgi:hypothetical protein